METLFEIQINFLPIFRIIILYVEVNIFIKIISFHVFRPAEYDSGVRFCRSALENPNKPEK